MTVALACCMLITLTSLVYIFAVDGECNLTAHNTRASYLRERKDAAYENLRDLNFEYRAGKISEADYCSLKTTLQNEAAILLAELGSRGPICATKKKTINRRQTCFRLTQIVATTPTVFASIVMVVRRVQGVWKIVAHAAVPNPRQN